MEWFSVRRKEKQDNFCGSLLKTIGNSSKTAVQYKKSIQKSWELSIL